ncbi:MAG TPA: hypothetical protein VKB95_17490 [Chitinophagaceae bacterium]|nr:hypothetical protein [Chitinophagaceae bacterium]
MPDIFNFDSEANSPGENSIHGDLKIVYKLLADMPDGLGFFIYASNCNLLQLLDAKSSRNRQQSRYTVLFQQSHAEVFYNYNYLLNDVEGKMKNQDSATTNEFHQSLKKIGMTDKNLELKTTLLQRFWNKLKNLKEKAADKILNFRLPNIRSLFKKLMSCLNSILGSLTKLFPALDPIKEFKEMLESATDLVDEKE